MIQCLEHLHHLGVATVNLAQTREFVEASFPVSGCIGPVFDSNLNCELLLLVVRGMPAIELVAGPAVKSIIRRGVMLYHMCYEINDLESVLANLKRAGSLIVISPTPSVLFKGRRVSFIHTPVGLIELLERRDKKDLR
jgi:methylmalonyl-CoA/ethylmalonyl-CoA epimerase